MRARVIPLILGIVCCLAMPAFADWSEADGHKMHFPQLPDPTGWDVCLIDQYLADDFQCGETGPITDIHFWISWRFDEVGMLPPVEQWQISLWSDGGGVPGVQLWTFTQGTMMIAGPWQGEQGWTCPSSGLIQPNDHMNYWQVNIVDILEPYYQQQGTRYWLVIRIPWAEMGVPGWKTSVSSPPGVLWGNPAVWATMPPAWQPINTGSVAPVMHDLAFVITGGHGQEAREYGDAPEDDLAYPSLGVVGIFPTCINVLVAPYIEHNNFGAYFGPSFDLEMEGNAGLCPTFGPASYDADECFQDGDAGLLFPEAYTIRNATVIPCPGFLGTPLGNICTNATWGGNVDMDVHNHMPSNTTGYVNVLIDWNQDGQWNGSSICPNGTAQEHVLVNWPVPNPFDGPLSALLPPGFLIGPKQGYVWARFSITEQQVAVNWDGSGIFEDGETEDYLLFLTDDEPEEYDFGDAPEGSLAYPSLGTNGQFPTCITVGPAGYVQHPGSQVFFGPMVDLEPDGNGGFCPQFTPNLYDQDECFLDGDAGLIIPEPFTIAGPVGGEMVTTCPNSLGTSLGIVCTNATWGGNIDIDVNNNGPLDVFVNVLIDWNQDGQWNGASTCPGGTNAPEHVLVNFAIPSPYNGPLSTWLPPGFLIGPRAGYVWARFTISDQPVPTDWNGEGYFGLGETEDYLLLVSDEEPEEYDFGDAPEGSIAYPSLGTNGQFPTCITVGPANWVQHVNSQAFFGPLVDLELDGNGGFCPQFTPNLYDQDECFLDGDAGLIMPEPFTITGPAGGEAVTTCPNSLGTPLGLVCTNATWGGNIDIDVNNNALQDVFVNVLIDWNQDGQWNGVSTCPGGFVAPEHVLVNFALPFPFNGPLSAALPPGFLIGPNPGYVWARFTVSDQPVPTDWNGEGYFGLGETEDYLLLVIDEEQPEYDLGDAPDSSNNFGTGMTAYFSTLTPANYPTVFNDGSGLGPYGPLHLQPRALAYLGRAVSLEQEADIGLDEDPTNNLDPPPDVADLDLNDDGVIFPLVLPHCQNATFDYVVTSVAAGPTTLFVNVWFDWTRDGDWDDVPACPGPTPAPEWAVQNQIVALPAPGQYTISTPLFYSWHPGDPEEEIWMRITLSEQQWQPGAQPGFGGSGPASGYEYGETEDYLFNPKRPRVKWSQPPHGEFEGFDAASDFWWNDPLLPGIKWIQNPITTVPGLHSHDYVLPPYGWVRTADDWQCQGGVVTDLHWWGNYELDAFGQERRGAGIDHFELNIYDDAPGIPFPLPLDPAPVWTMNVPFADVNETDTGLVNNEGCRIYYYTYQLPAPFDQVAGQFYWFSPMAIAADPLDYAYWRWQEANRSAVFLGHAPAAQRTDLAPWSSVSWTGANLFSDMAFIITSREPQPDEVNRVVADDFISDGRPIEGVRWWGSYLDQLFMPEEQVEPYVIDGWFISFHHTLDDAVCPPDLLNGDDPTVLGIYFAPADAVHYKNMGYQDCLDHPVYEYFVNFDRCCLICSEVDPRDGDIPAQEGAFYERQGYGYWLDIQAVVGVKWDPASIPCTLVPTGHLPSPNNPDGHFWGWHTSPGPADPCSPLYEACFGRIVDMLPYPPDCWDYGMWQKQPWECPVPPDPQPVNMAYELITHDPDPCPCPGDMNGDGVVNGQDIQPFVDCILGNPTAPGVNCFCGDLNCTKTIEIGDVPLFVDLLLITPTCP